MIVQRFLKDTVAMRSMKTIPRIESYASAVPRWVHERHFFMEVPARHHEPGDARSRGAYQCSGERPLCGAWAAGSTSQHQSYFRFFVRRGQSWFARDTLWVSSAGCVRSPRRPCTHVRPE